MPKLTHYLDFFKAPVPSFSINNKKSLGTSIGFILSILVATVLLAFTVTKGIIMIRKSQAIITQFTVDHRVKEIDVDKMGFAMAFRITNGRRGRY